MKEYAQELGYKNHIHLTTKTNQKVVNQNVYE